MRINKRTGCNKRPRGQTAAAETAREHNPQEQQEGTKECYQTTHPRQSQRRTSRQCRRRPNYQRLLQLHKQRSQCVPLTPQARSTPSPKQGETKKRTELSTQRRRTAGGDEVNPDLTTNKALHPGVPLRHHHTARQREVTTLMAEPQDMVRPQRPSASQPTQEKH